MATNSRSEYNSSINESRYTSPQSRHAVHIDANLDTIESSHEFNSLIRDSCYEFLGTALFVYISLSGVHQAALPTIGTTNNVDQVHVASCFAIGLTSGILLAQKSGGHLNPAVSATLWIAGEISLGRMFSYIACQLLGGFAGALGVLAIHGSRLIELRPKHELALIGMFGTLKGDNNSLVCAIIDQFIGSALLMVAIIATPATPLKPIIVGGALGALGLFQGTNGFAFNMARDLSPRIASTILYGAAPFAEFASWVWVPIVIPFFGVPFGFVLVQLLTM